MDKKMELDLGGMDRLARADYFAAHKSELAAVGMDNANVGDVENPNSSICPYKNCWYSSPGFICNGEQVC